MPPTVVLPKGLLPDHSSLPLWMTWDLGNPLVVLLILFFSFYIWGKSHLSPPCFRLMYLLISFESFIKGFEDPLDSEPNLEQLNTCFLYSRQGWGSLFFKPFQEIVVIFVFHHSNVAKKFKKSKRTHTHSLIYIWPFLLVTRATIRKTALRDPEGQQIDPCRRWRPNGRMSRVYRQTQNI